MVLLQGPPGTGKTSTVVPLLLLLVEHGHRVLACAPTNIAVAEVAKKLVRDLQAGQLLSRHIASGCVHCCNSSSSSSCAGFGKEGVVHASVSSTAPGDAVRAGAAAFRAVLPPAAGSGAGGSAAAATCSGGSSSAPAPVAPSQRLPASGSSKPMVRPAHVVFVHSVSSSHAAAAAEQLTSISLYDRMERLVSVLNPLGWRYQLQQLMCFFEEAIIRYCQLQQQQLEEEKKEQQQGKGEGGVKGAEVISREGATEQQHGSSSSTPWHASGLWEEGFWGWCLARLVPMLQKLVTSLPVLLEELPDAYFQPGQQGATMQVNAW